MIDFLEIFYFKFLSVLYLPFAFLHQLNIYLKSFSFYSYSCSLSPVDQLKAIANTLTKRQRKLFLPISLIPIYVFTLFFLVWLYWLTFHRRKFFYSSLFSFSCSPACLLRLKKLSYRWDFCEHKQNCEKFIFFLDVLFSWQGEQTLCGYIEKSLKYYKQI